MTNLSNRLALASVALIASVKNSHVEAATFQSGAVACLPEAPDICVGVLSGTTPSPGIFCEDPNNQSTCTGTYIGGYSWTYNFVEGLENGTNIYETPWEDLEAAETGLQVSVSLDDAQETCSVQVGDALCATCSPVDCIKSADYINITFAGFSITYDCTNVPNGTKTEECDPLDSVFYPLSLGMDSDTDGTSAPTDIIDSPSSAPAWKGLSLTCSIIMAWFAI